SIQVASLMSMGVQTIRASEPVVKASGQMQRTGHEGIPVLEGGKLVGLLTRRAVDRAMSHGMGHQTVRQIMDAGEVTVSPEDSIEVRPQRMMRSGWGQIPVVDHQDRLLGIVTRTDLIKRWGQHPDDARREEIAMRMRKTLPPGMWRLIEAIARQAQTINLGLYVVGGFVRDLLLGQPNVDVDLVVEGDAVELVRRLQDAYGGEIRSHAQFGTAKWLLGELVAAALGVDFASAGWPSVVD